ncbi:MAG: oligosaccharide flippase family protein [Candidatus Pacebacteria bacterium]|nr:oligosaccharide flippase family protein [Candidatus Paceibacterota bacterium]
MKSFLLNNYHNHKETIHNFGWRALQIVGKQGINFGIFVLCIKLLNLHDFGIYNYILAIIFLLIMFGDFGISTATSKYIAEYNAVDKEKLKMVVFNSGLMILILTIMVTFLTITIGPLYLKEKYIYVLWLLPLIFLAPMTSLYDGIYRGLNKFKELAIVSLFVGSISIFIIYFLIKSYGLIGALLAQNIFYLILLLGLIFGHQEFKMIINRKIINEIGRYSFLIGLSGVGYFLYSRISTLMLGHYGYITEISYYELLNKFFVFLIIPFSILGEVIAPKNTRLYALKKIILLKQKFIKYFVISIIMGILVSIIFWYLLPMIVSIYLPQYDTSILKEFLKIQIFIFFILVSTATINNGIITPTNYTKWIMISSIFFGVLNFPMSMVLHYYLSYNGIILSSLITYILNTSSVYLIYYKTTFKETENEKNLHTLRNEA